MNRLAATPSRRALSLCGLLAAFALLLPADALAQLTTDTAGDPGYMTNAYIGALQNLNAAMDAVLAPGSVYMQWSRNLLLGAFAIALVVALARYVAGGCGAAELAETVAMGAIITALFSAYTYWTGLFFEGAVALGLLVQQQALGDNSIFGPAMYVAKTWARFELEGTSILSLSITRLAFYGLFCIIEVILIAACFFASLWPSLIFAVSKLVGPVLFPTLFHERLSGFFDGWLRFYVGSLVFAFVGRICLVVVAIMFGSIFATGYTPGAADPPILIQPDSAGSMAVLLTLGILSILLIFSAGAFSAAIAGGGNFGIARTVGRLAQSAVRMIF
jgi:hypothetical protein